ncbi:MAG TPA: hypothetical protein VGL81_36060 [Polyangiaceae bacterium]|jgi:hypothetical protein
MTLRAWAAALGGVALAAGAAGAAAQTADVERPRTLVVGSPAGGARTDRIDAARSGRSGTALPLAESGGLRIEWKAAIGASVDVAPVVDARGSTYVVGARGEIVAVARDGSERWRVTTGAIQPSAPALLSDDSLVFSDAAGEAVAVREGVVRWRVRFGRSDPARAVPPAPVALDDGGVVVATARDLAVLDAEGHERSRMTLPESTAFPLVAALGKILAVTSSGAVWSWAPGASEVTRVASFGGPIDDGAALADDHTLLAVVGGRQHLVAVDLIRATTTTRAVTPSGLWLGPPSMTAGTAHLLLQAPTSELALAVDASGSETSRALLTTHPPPISADGGVAQLVALPHTPLLVDAAGTLAFATVDGGVGVVSGGVVDVVADVCPPAPGPRGAAAATAALAPLGAGAFVALCRAGTLVAVRSGGSGSGGKPAPHL